MATTTENDGARTKKPKGRPAKPYPSIPDTYENIVKALVKPVGEDREDD